jgi:two-component system response regulator MprA
MPRILLVDDDPDILETLRFALEQSGFDVDTASDGQAALDAARAQPPAVVILDVMLPGMNGYEVARWLKQDVQQGRLPELRILMLTARRVASAARRELLDTWSQADASLWKPFELATLLATVRRLAAARTPVGGPA